MLSSCNNFDGAAGQQLLDQSGAPLPTIMVYYHQMCLLNLAALAYVAD
jgi:hypothetical protein